MLPICSNIPTHSYILHYMYFMFVYEFAFLFLTKYHCNISTDINKHSIKQSSTCYMFYDIKFWIIHVLLIYCYVWYKLVRKYKPLAPVNKEWSYLNTVDIHEI